MQIIFSGFARDPKLTHDQFLAEQMGAFVWSLAPWQVFATFTFEWESSQDSARRLYERFMRQHLPWVSNFYSIEQNPSRDGHHVHAIWCDCQHTKRKDIWAEWYRKYGRARIEPVKGMADVSAYCGKYVTKGNAWWDFRLMGTRHPRQQDLQLDQEKAVAGGWGGIHPRGGAQAVLRRS
jgi:hypothetical protein